MHRRFAKVGRVREPNERHEALAGSQVPHALQPLLRPRASFADTPPDIAVHWNRVTLRLWTHTAGAITNRDVELAARMNDLA